MIFSHSPISRVHKEETFFTYPWQAHATASVASTNDLIPKSSRLVARETANYHQGDRDVSSRTSPVLYDRFTGHQRSDSSHFDTVRCHRDKSSIITRPEDTSVFARFCIIQFFFLSRHDDLFSMHDTVHTFRGCTQTPHSRVASQLETKAPSYSPPV